MRLSLKTWTLSAVALIYIVIILGAYTRLKDAGLGCPDWPGCYGALLAPTTNYNPEAADIAKAWTEMIHRYVAGSLGLLILGITIKTILIRKQQPKLWILSCIILCVVVFQALLGMWTVTLRLYPIVVMGHLLGGFTILALTWLLYLQMQQTKHRINKITILKVLSILALCMLIIQIALGGWTSANYAALVCADFPQCQGSLWPAMDWRGAFNVSAVGIFDSPGIPLENTARVTIQMFHRIGALFTTILFIILGYCLIKTQSKHFRTLGILLISALIIQVILGITNVLARLPLFVSLMHNAVAALLLLLMVTTLYYLYSQPKTNNTSRHV